jgi:hypothetical protein
VKAVLHAEAGVVLLVVGPQVLIPTVQSRRAAVVSGQFALFALHISTHVGSSPRTDLREDPRLVSSVHDLRAALLALAHIRGRRSGGRCGWRLDDAATRTGYAAVAFVHQCLAFVRVPSFGSRVEKLW